MLKPCLCSCLGTYADLKIVDKYIENAKAKIFAALIDASFAGVDDQTEQLLIRKLLAFGLSTDINSIARCWEHPLCLCYI